MVPTAVRQSRIARLLIVMSAVALLAACTSAPVMGPGPPPLIGAKKTRALGPAPLKGEAAKFAFMSVTGVPAEMRFALDGYLKEFAATRNLTLVPEGDPSAVYHVRGYLSALGDDNGTLLVYTWDITDAAGTPLYRISGQETAAGSATDPWLGVTSTEVSAAARETIDQLADWVKG